MNRQVVDKCERIHANKGPAVKSVFLSRHLKTDEKGSIQKVILFCSFGVILYLSGIVYFYPLCNFDSAHDVLPLVLCFVDQITQHRIYVSNRACIRIVVRQKREICERTCLRHRRSNPGKLSLAWTYWRRATAQTHSFLITFYTRRRRWLMAIHTTQWLLRWLIGTKINSLLNKSTPFVQRQTLL